MKLLIVDDEPLIHVSIEYNLRETGIGGLEVFHAYNGSEMLKTVAEICEKNNIRWYMAYGSTLGAIRHGGPIPWDYDIDIYVPECDLDTFLSAMKRELPSKYWVDYREGRGPYRAFPRIGLTGYETEILHIDVYRLGGLPDDPKKLKLFTRYSRLLFVN